ncbi:MAG TPA: TauD/TfdA family dioxygenase [Planctomycetota bacterium]|nr:TauD/TfdA family dioxygenase [Planctomycetota bacterium]
MPATATIASPIIDVCPVTPVIGAEIAGVDLSRAPDPETTAQIIDALHRWRVLFFRSQPLTDEQFLRFGRSLGPLTPAHPIAAGLPQHPEIWERAAAEYKERYVHDRAVPVARPARDYQGWHIDITFMANPNRYSILRGVKIPAYGGDTLWSNLALAYQGLSAPIRTLVDELTAVHRTSAYDSAGERTDGKKKPGPFAAQHPLVRIHPGTGEKILFFNPGVISHIVGLKERESQTLIDLLASEITRPEYTVRFRWSPDALVIWDNQATAHAGPIDYAHFDQPRVVRRITVAGDLTIGSDGFRSRPLEGELFGVIG